MSDNDDGNVYSGFDPKTVEAFNRWHQFHDDLVKLGGFSTWLSDGDNKVDLVTFFAMDTANRDQYHKALENQTAYLDAIRQMVDQVRAMLVDYETKKNESPDTD